MEFVDLAMQCAPMVHVQTMTGLVKTESAFNPFAIGVVNGRLARQPRSLAEAVATVRSLEAQGYNYSVGYSQVNKTNFKKYGLTHVTAFEPCANLRAGGSILAACFASAKRKFSSEQGALQAALSCYYSGNFRTGFKQDFKGQPSYVNKVIANATGRSSRVAIPVYRTETAPKGRAGVRATEREVTAVDAGESRSALVF